MIRVLFAALLSLSLTTARASTITVMPRGADDRYNFYIQGPIARGDYKRLTTIIKQRQEFPYIVSIESPGGDVKEAMAIGRLFRKALVSVHPSQGCNSACALIVFASANYILSDPKDDGGEIGIHRPIYDPVYFAGLSFAEAQEKTRELDQAVRAYLKEMDVPNDIADKMMTVPSNDAVYLTIRDYRNRASPQPPAVFEWLKARCGALDPREMQDFGNVIAYRNYNSFIKLPDGESFAARYRERAQLGAQLSSGYRDYLYEKGEKLNSCHEGAIEQERRRILLTIE